MTKLARKETSIKEFGAGQSIAPQIHPQTASCQLIVRVRAINPERPISRAWGIARWHGLRVYLRSLTCL